MIRSLSFSLANRYPWLPVLLVGSLLCGCTSTARIANTSISEPIHIQQGEITRGQFETRSDEAFLYVSMSGGGTRAAAFAYGVLQELRDTRFERNGKSMRLLDEVDYISSVSGGSFTAAYYGLFGDRLFEDYEHKFLRHNVQQTLIGSALNPFNWLRGLFTGFNRTEMAIAYYDKNIFMGGTFADVRREDGPYLAINASDIGIGARFTFTQERFNLLCSDLGTFSVARAVAASSAVPVAFTPVTLENFDSCAFEKPQWFSDGVRQSQDPRLQSLITDLESYRNKEERRFIHLVDGGITDNLGLRSLLDRVDLMGGAGEATREIRHRPKFIAVIVINAETRPENPIDRSQETPSSAQVVSAVTDTQIARYNIESLSMLENSLREWSNELSSSGEPVRAFLIPIDFQRYADKRKRTFLNNVSTSFSLPDDEVDLLIDAGRTLLRESPDFQALIRAMHE